MVSSKFTVPADWLRNVIEIVNPSPPLLGELMNGAGLHWSDLGTPGTPIPQRAEATFVEQLADHMGDTSFPAELGLKMSGQTSTVVSYILHSSRNLGDAMKNTARIVPLTRPAVIVRFGVSNGVCRWSLDNHDPWVRESTLYQEFAISVVLAGFRTATGQKLRPAQVRLRPQSRARLPRLSHLWECPTTADCETIIIEFPEAAMDIPLTRFDAPLLSHLQSYSEILLKERPPQEPELRLTVEREILNELTHGAPPLSSVAAALGMSTRTLSRRLGEIGISYRQLLEDVRRRKSLLMLREGSLSLAEIAFILGYSEQSSFTNAFRRWTGLAPGVYRARWRDGQEKSALDGS